MEKTTIGKINTSDAILFAKGVAELRKIHCKDGIPVLEYAMNTETWETIKVLDNITFFIDIFYNLEKLKKGYVGILFGAEIKIIPTEDNIVQCVYDGYVIGGPGDIIHDFRSIQ